MKLKLLLKRFGPVLIGFGLALTFAFAHIIIQSGAFEAGPLSKQSLLHLLDLKSLDLKFQARTIEDLPEPKVTVAGIDEKGVERFGLWPWSRRVTADFIRAAGEKGAKAISFDAVYSDTDKNSSYVSVKKFLDAFDTGGMSADRGPLKNIEARIAQAERLEQQTAKAIAAAEEKIRKGTTKGPKIGLPQLNQAKALRKKNSAALMQARTALGELKKRTSNYRELMRKEVNAISPDQELAQAIEAHTKQVIMGYFNFSSETEIVGTSVDEAIQAFERLEPVAIDQIYENQVQLMGDQEIVMMQPVPEVSIEDLQIREAVATRAPRAEFAEKTSYFGFFNVPPDADGTMRRIRLFNKHKGKMYPALSLMTAALYFDADIRPLNGDIFPGETLGGIASLNPERDQIVPVNHQGHLMVNYYNDPMKYFPTYSVADFIDGTVPEEAIKDKVVLFGMTAIGLFDLRPTPFSATTPGVYIHASAIQNMIDGRYVSRAFGLALIEALLYLALGILMGVIIPRIPAWAGVLFTVGFSAMLYWVDINFIFNDGTWILNVLPILQASVTFLGINVYMYLTEGREKAQIREAFQFYLTKSVVDEMLEDTSKLKLGGEKRVCTVLFSDIRGFTTISEKLSPEELVQLLNEYLTPMTNIVFKYDGTLDKYMGDAIMAIFGAPVPHKDHSVRACYACIEMMEELEVLQRGWRERGVPELDIGIGLNTGNMSVGNMGSEVRFDYTVMGDNVNLGSRLEGINKQYGTNIIISEYTKDEAGDAVHTRELDSVRVKGKKEPVVIFELLGKGQPDENTAKMIETFEGAIGLYKAQKWDEAIAQFDSVRKEIKENDFASGMYIDRCLAMKEEPPGEDWDGVYTMTTK